MTAPARLKSLRIEGFRGASSRFQLDFDPATRMTLVYGENGSGKTTICDALEFLSAERVGSLDGKSVGSAAHRFWPTIGRDAGDVAIHLETASGVCAGVMRKNKAHVAPDAERPSVVLFRRRQLLDLVEAQPAARYEAIKRFIDIDAFERSEDALRSLVRSLDQEIASAATRRDGALETLGGIAGKMGMPATGVVAWARQRVADAADGSAALATAEPLRHAHEMLREFPERLRDGLARVEKVEADETAARGLALAAVDGGSAASEKEVALLRAAGELLAAHQPDACPLCESRELVDGLHARVEQRLAALRLIDEAVARRLDATRSVELARSALADMRAAYGRAAAAFEAARKALGDAVPGAPAQPEGLEGWLAATAAHAERWAAEEARRRDDENFRRSLSVALGLFDAEAAKLAEVEALRPRAAQALAACVEERQAFVTGVITDIAQRVGELYERVHPGEGLNKIALPLVAGRAGSIELHSEFAGHAGPPQAYFSQSHLDTLGLCIFLALALREAPETKVLVLDDVLGSIDEPHVDRVIDMLYDVGQAFRHTIITTHYQPWKAKYRWGELSPGKDCQFVELTPWTLHAGVRTSASRPEIERLRAMLAAADFDGQNVCAKAGVILERLLDELTLRYACAVPRRRDGAHTIGDMLPTIRKDLRGVMVVDTRRDDGTYHRVVLKDPLDELDRIMQVRNVAGAHYNRLGDMLPPADLRRFGETVLRLGDALICPSHGWPTKQDANGYWRNRGDTRRLFPLLKP